MAQPAPKPTEWQIANAQELQVTDREVLAMLRAAKRRVDKILAELPAGQQEIKRAQLESTRARLLAEQASVFERLGDIVAARRARAASRSAGLSAAADRALLDLVGKGAEGQFLYESALQVGQRQIDAALARMKHSQLPLSKRIYNSSVWMGGRLGKLINETLATGLNAKEFAKRARDWFNPNTPGGVRYAAMRLARTEINNAFHAMTAEKAARDPWITEVEWNLSKSHPKPDICNKVAEESPFPSDRVPARPHPQCMCYITPSPIAEDEFVENFLKGDYDEFLDSELAKNGWLEPEQAEVREEAEPPVASAGPVSPLKVSIGTGITAERRLTGGVAAQTDLIETADGKKIIRKTMGGEAVPGIPQLNDAKRQADAEELGSMLLRAMGANAPEVYRESDTVIYMEFIDNAKPALEYSLNNNVQDMVARDLGPVIALFDTVCSNVDRNPGNWMAKLGANKDDSAVYPIDHGFAFTFEPGKELDPSPYQERFGGIAYARSPFWRMTHGGDRGVAYQVQGSGEWADNEFSPADIEAFRKILTQMEPEFTARGQREWYEISLRRLNEFAKYAKGTELHINANS